MEIIMFEKIARTYRGVKQGKAWQNEFDSKAPKAGDPAPDFTLSDVRGENQIQLSRLFEEKPVALVFGSFT